ncbi:MBL fold metallo-hydrolase [Paracoccus yeei]|uniref:MBL fold metallo-hydrolase n=1 Tax=Paracoccus yeei TaxID=147645 RepID=UPI00056D449B|nr:MBL fold metallo-hydrolase [Paracoccus yeei]OWJ98535.1 MBL fold metallo-hydrolase [Paracoccus yeei]
MLKRLATAILLAAAIPAQAGDIRVTLLGTGSPLPSPDRFSQSTLVEAGSEKLLFDMGRGATIRLTQIDVPLSAITAHFITHMHSDHVVGLPDVWLTGWTPTPFGNRKTPFVLYGPQGTRDMAAHLAAAFSEDRRIRIEDEQIGPEGLEFDAHDIGPGPVYDRNGVTVTAFEVNHGPRIKPAYGYRIDHDGKSVVISGDTRYDTRVAEAARGADLLVHEVAYIDPSMIRKFPSYQGVLDHHTTPEEAGRIFALAKPRVAVFSHIVSRGAPGMTREQIGAAIVAEARAGFDGAVLLGQDLTAITIGDRITVTDPDGRTVLTEDRAP